MGFQSWVVQWEGVGAAERDLHSSISEGWVTQHPQSLLEPSRGLPLLSSA